MTAKPRPVRRDIHKALHLSIAAALIAVVSLPQRVHAVSQDLQPRFEKLSNGLRICIVEEHSQPLVSVQLWFGSGSAVDPPTLPGLGHVALAALVQQSKRNPSDALANSIVTYATLPDAGYVARTARSGDLDLCLTWAAGFLQPLQITTEHLNAARDVAAAEWAAQADSSDQQQRRLLLAAMFPNHPYRNPPRWIGQRLETVKPELLREFSSRWFTVANATLFVMGDVEPAIAIQKAREHFGSIRWSDMPGPGERALPEREHRIVACAENTVTIAWLTPPAGRMDRIILLVAREIVRNRLSRHAPGFTITAEDSDILTARDASILTLVGKPYGPQAAGLILTELDQLAKKGCTESELIQARNQVGRRACKSGFGFDNWSLRLATSEMVAGDILLADLAARQAQRVTVADVQHAARAMNQGLRRVILTPDSGSSEVDTNPPSLDPPFQPAGEPANSPTTKTPGSPVNALQSGRLENGLKWTVDRLPYCGFARLELNIRVQTAQPPKIDPIRPPGDNPRKDLQELLDFRGIQSTTGTLPDGWTVVIDGPRDETDAMIELLGNARRLADGTWANFDRLQLVVRGDFSASEAEALARKLGD